MVKLKYLEANIALSSLSLMGSHSIWVLAASLRLSPYFQAQSIYTRSYRAGPSCSSECFGHGAHIPLSNADGRFGVQKVLIKTFWTPLSSAFIRSCHGTTGLSRARISVDSVVKVSVTSFFFWMYTSERSPQFFDISMNHVTSVSETFWMGFLSPYWTQVLKAQSKFCISFNWLISD